jgi:hypothetical protein
VPKYLDHYQVWYDANTEEVVVTAEPYPDAYSVEEAEAFAAKHLGYIEEMGDKGPYSPRTHLIVYRFALPDLMFGRPVPLHFAQDYVSHWADKVPEGVTIPETPLPHTVLEAWQPPYEDDEWSTSKMTLSLSNVDVEVETYEGAYKWEMGPTECFVPRHLPSGMWGEIPPHLTPLDEHELELEVSLIFGDERTYRTHLQAIGALSRFRHSDSLWLAEVKLRIATYDFLQAHTDAPGSFAYWAAWAVLEDARDRRKRPGMADSHAPVYVMAGDASINRRSTLRKLAQHITGGEEVGLTQQGEEDLPGMGRPSFVIYPGVGPRGTGTSTGTSTGFDSKHYAENMPLLKAAYRKVAYWPTP